VKTDPPSKNRDFGETEIPIPMKKGGFLSLAGLCPLCPLSLSNFSKNTSLVKNTSLPVFNRGGLFEKRYRKTDLKIEKLK
jgi:hypothetical protein